MVECIVENLKSAKFNDLAATKNINFKAKISEELFLEYFFNTETKALDSIFPTLKL
jgi:hypothetical protein